LGIADDLIRKYQSFPKIKRDQKFDSLALYCLEYMAAIQPVIRGHQFDVLFTVKKENISSDKWVQQIVFCTWFKQYLKDNIANGNLVPSISTPLIEPPIDWTSFRNGGFHSDEFKYKIISRGRSSDYKYSDLEVIYKTLNKIQKTGLRINKKVHDIFQHSVTLNLGLGNLPRNEEPNFIPYPFEGVNFKDLDEDKKKVVVDWAKNKTNMHRIGASNNSKYMKMYRTAAEAKRFSTYDNIYFAYFVDYRGRIYPKANALSPQGDKYSKALLQFSEGKAIDTRDAEMFLAMHGANTFGEDKISFADKHLLILTMHEDILTCAKNPLDSEAIWHKADDPWNFLAFCFEWEQYSREGTSFKSHLSIAMDGSCNGLQHLSAMFLDEVGGKSVNLTNNPTKGDIYSDVQNLTIHLLNSRKTAIGKKLVEINAVTRTSCKKPVMTVPYAGTKN
jgi:DNA-directed RNA polymerase